MCIFILRLDFIMHSLSCVSSGADAESFVVSRHKLAVIVTGALRLHVSPYVSSVTVCWQCQLQ